MDHHIIWPYTGPMFSTNIMTNMGPHSGTFDTHQPIIQPARSATIVDDLSLLLTGISMADAGGGLITSEEHF